MLDPDTSGDMISASDTREFVPHGRDYMSSHPGKTTLYTQTGAGPRLCGVAPVPGCAPAAKDHGLPLVKALRDFSISVSKRESWQMRGGGRGAAADEDCDEELYVCESTAVWSRGCVDGGGRVVKSYTLDSHIQQALWCNFLLPLSKQSMSRGGARATPNTISAKVQEGVCLIEDKTVNIFTTQGQDYKATLPFPIHRAWSIDNGILFELDRNVTESATNTTKTPKREDKILPVLFSMLHPLDEVAPVISKTGGSAGKLSYVTETSQCIVFSCTEPSLVVTYDRVHSVHSVYRLRRAKQEEAFAILANIGGGSDSAAAAGLMPPPDTPGHLPGAGSTSTSMLAGNKSQLSRLTAASTSTHSPGTPFSSYSSRCYSPGMSSLGQTSKIGSPSFNLTLLSRSHSPSLGGLIGAHQGAAPPRLHSPSPRRLTGSPRTTGNLHRTPQSLNTSLGVGGHMFGSDFEQQPLEPITPEVCIDHVWTETGAIVRDGAAGQASKVFLTRDLCGRRYLCYLVAYRHQLRCVKFDESNDRHHLIFGSVSCLQARDAVPLPKLNMLLLLDLQHSVVLYTGTVKMSKVHVGGLPVPINLSMCGTAGDKSMPHTPFDSPMRFSSGPVTSSRPPSALGTRFDDSGPALSPVPTEFNESSQPIDTSSLNEDLSFVGGANQNGLVSGIKDPVGNRFTLELNDGSFYRTSLPQLTSSPVISKCLAALRQILPRDTSLQVMIRWYAYNNAPGSINGQSQWMQFQRCLLQLMGYNIGKLALTQQYELDSSLSPVLAPKKQKPNDNGTEDDWAFLLQSEHHHMSPLLPGLATEGAATSQGQRSGVSNSAAGSIDTHALLFPHIPGLTFALHLLYQELKLDMLYIEELHLLGAMLHQLTRDLRCDLFADQYRREHPQLFHNHGQTTSQISPEHLQQMSYPSYLTKDPPDIYEWLKKLMAGESVTPFPILPDVSHTTRNVIAMYVVLLTPVPVKDITWTNFLRKVSGHRSPDSEEVLQAALSQVPASANPYQRTVLFMAHLGVTKDILCNGIALPLKEAVFNCRSNPPGDWPEKAYQLIGREDLTKQRQKQPISERSVDNNKRNPDDGSPSGGMWGKEDDHDGMEYCNKDLLKLRWSEDLRVQETRRLLQSSRPVRIALTQRPEVSDHDFIEEQERHLYSVCVRTMALPLGRALFTMCTYHPVATETLPLPKLCLTGRAPPRNTTIDLTHIDTPPNMNHWPLFHNGVAAGLRIADSSQLNSTWILYNKNRGSSELTNEHAGFLMGLGLNGHLRSLETLIVHDYLARGHEMTSIGVLLGISAGLRGTMDVSVTRLLSIHLAALLPPTSTELDVTHNVQVAAILGVGLVYQGTAHRHIAEVLLSEIGRPPGPEMDNCTDRESYSLSAGLALGMVMLGKGGEVGLSDLSMADELYHYMAGGHKRPMTGANKERYKSPSYQIKEGDCVNVDVTSPGATLALGMMFFRSSNAAVADWLRAPDTQYLLDFVRPDFLMLRVISYGLVMWDAIAPTEAWIMGNMPDIVDTFAFNKMKYKDDPDCAVDFETMSQAYLNILGGACMALGLRFAGSANQAAFACLYSKVKTVLKLLSTPLLVEQAGKSTAENCLLVIVVSLAMVMAGTGSLEVLRLCKHLRSRVGANSHVLYGSHMAVSMSLGLLFMGGGRYSLSTRPEAVAAMLCAFFPKFPIHSNDQRYHLQALRHLYVLAAEPRVLLPRDVDTGRPCYVPLHIKFKDCENYRGVEYEDLAPCLLPELSLLGEVAVQGPRYWPVTFTPQLGSNWATLQSMLSVSGCVWVKQRAGHLSYAADPHGYHSVLSQSLTTDQPLGKLIKPEDIESFSSDPRILAFAEHFCSVAGEEEYELCQLLSKLLYECVTQEKPEILPTHIAMYQAVRILESGTPKPLLLRQLKLMLSFYECLVQRHWNSLDQQNPLMSSEFLTALKNMVEKVLAPWQKDSSSNGDLVAYFSGEGAVSRPHLLASYLTWYNIPTPARLAQLQLKGAPSFPDLYKLLCSSGLPVPSVRSLTAVLQRIAAR